MPRDRHTSHQDEYPITPRSRASVSSVLASFSPGMVKRYQPKSLPVLLRCQRCGSSTDSYCIGNSGVNKRDRYSNRNRAKPAAHRSGKYKVSLQTEEMMDSLPETQCPRRHRTGKLGSLNIKAPTIMKTTLPTASIAAALAMSCVSAFAENTPGYNEEIPADIMTPDSVETSIGTLNPIVS